MTALESVRHMESFARKVEGDHTMTMVRKSQSRFDRYFLQEWDSFMWEELSWTWEMHLSQHHQRCQMAVLVIANRHDVGRAWCIVAWQIALVVFITVGEGALRLWCPLLCRRNIVGSLSTDEFGVCWKTDCN